VECAGKDFTPSAPKLRDTLALLLLNVDRLMPFSSFIRELWDEDPPQSASTTLQTYILQLRKLLSRALGVDDRTAREILVTRQGGYLLSLDPQLIDFYRFEQLSLKGRHTLASGDVRRATHYLRSALSLWRGPALADVTTGPVLEPRVRGLEELRLVTLEQRIEAELRLGAHREVLSELATLTSQFRFNENLHGQYMLALHRSGRRSDALNVFRRLRERLVEELGLEPSKRLHQFQHAVLTSDCDATYSAI
jgi:DNA-binding SARP family transcriptional activator